MENRKYTDNEMLISENGDKDIKELEMRIKKEVDGIRVPAEALERIKQGVEAGTKADKNKEAGKKAAENKPKETKSADILEIGVDENRKKAAENTGARPASAKGLIYLKRTVASLAACMGMIIVLSNIDPVISNAMAKLPLIGAISKVVTFRTFEDSNNGFEADISIPKVVTENGEELQANKDISAYADKLIAQYESEIAAADGEGHYSISSTYETVYDGDRYLCLKVNTTLVMASGTEYVKIFTIDKTTGKTVMLKDLADGEMLKKISKNIISQMTEQMAEDENVTYFIGTETPEWDFNGLDGSESFYFDSEGSLVICFDEYQVAPGHMGAVEFTIPKEITGELQSH